MGRGDDPPHAAGAASGRGRGPRHRTGAEGYQTAPLAFDSRSPLRKTSPRMRFGLLPEGSEFVRIHVGCLREHGRDRASGTCRISPSPRDVGGCRGDRHDAGVVGASRQSRRAVKFSRRLSGEWHGREGLADPCVLEPRGTRRARHRGIRSVRGTERVARRARRGPRPQPATTDDRRHPGCRPRTATVAGPHAHRNLLSRAHGMACKFHPRRERGRRRAALARRGSSAPNSHAASPHLASHRGARPERPPSVTP